MASTTAAGPARPKVPTPDPTHGPVLVAPRHATMPPRSRKTAAAWACLVLAEDSVRLEALAEASAQAGWDPIACRSIGEALRELGRWRTQLSIIDLGAMTNVQKAAYLQFAERTSSRDRLLLVCDEPNADANCHEGELRARQLGAWLYVPTPDLTEGFTQLLSEARGVAEKIAGDSLAGI